jgi:peroxiredoxin Q/BCP
MIKSKIFAGIILFSFFSFAQNLTELKQGDKAPDFSLNDSDGKSFSLSEYKGKSPVVLYFYPQANTSGCTKQACGIRDDWNKFKENNIVVLGVSVDIPEEIKKFVEDYNLNFPLLSDTDKNVSKMYGVLNEKGRAKRYTFIIDKDGRISKIIKVTDVLSHSKEVFEEAKKLNGVEIH